MLHNAVIMLLAECLPVKMHMYTEKDVLRWIDAELDNEAHNEMPPMPPYQRISHKHQRKGNIQT